MEQTWQNRLRRALAISTREQLTQDEISSQRDNLNRARILVNIRWMLLGTYIIFAIPGILIFLTGESVITVLRLLVVPAFAVALAVVYNLMFSRFSKRFANLSILNFTQLLLDVLVATTLVYFSGGVESWFWIIFVLFIFEAALVAPRKKDVWYLATVMSVCLVSVEWLDFLRIVPHQSIPWSSGYGWDDWRYVLIYQAWQLTIIFGSAWVASTLFVRLREMLDQSRGFSIVDEQTGLFSKRFFDRSVEIEVQRAASTGRAAYVGLIDMDQLSQLNQKFGIIVGDRLISAVATALLEEMRALEMEYASANALARLSGDEFAFLVVDNMHHEEGHVSVEDIEQLVKRMLERVGAVSVEGVSPTISIGWASYPTDGLDADGVWLRADEALAYASSLGGNQAVAARDMPLGMVTPTFSPRIYEDE